MELLLTSVIASYVTRESGMNNPRGESTVICRVSVQEIGIK